MKEKNIENKFNIARTIVESYGGTILGTLVQRRGISRFRKPGGVKKLNSPLNPVTFIGKGKAEELCKLAEEKSADVIIFLNDLKIKQCQNWKELTGCKVLTCVIK